MIVGDADADAVLWLCGVLRKHEQVIQEYEMLLTSTLDSQRHFYDDQLAMVAAEHERCRYALC